VGLGVNVGCSTDPGAGVFDEHDVIQTPRKTNDNNKHFKQREVILFIFINSLFSMEHFFFYYTLNMKRYRQYSGIWAEKFFPIEPERFESNAKAFLGHSSCTSHAWRAYLVEFGDIKIIMSKL
jgi:hypothetical protein